MGIQLMGMASGMDTASMVANLMKIENQKLDKLKGSKTKEEWTRDIWKETNTKLYSFYKTELFDFKSAGTYNQKKLSSSNPSAVKINSSTNSFNGTHSMNVTNTAKSVFLSGKLADGTTGSTTLKDLGIFANDTDTADLTFETTDADGNTVANTVTLTGSDTIDNLITNINAEIGDNDFSASYDSNFNSLFLNSKDTGANLQLKVSEDSGGNDILKKLGFLDGASTDTFVTKNGEDAEFTYNGISYTNSSNDININGLSMTLLGTTATDVSITSSTDVDAIYDSVKSFVSKYNELIEFITKKTEADSARGYEPLTKDQKAAMTDDEIKDWETKIKDSLLRKDSILTSLQADMRTSLYSVIKNEDGSSPDIDSLADLGIVTGTYKENGKLHIYGDKDEDPSYSIKSDKLRAAIEDDPEGVSNLLTTLGDKIYSKMQDSMRSNSLSSALTFYNDKSIKEELKSYDKKIFDLEKKLAETEQRYYKQFSAMEQAMQKSNSTGNWLAQQLSGMMN